MKDLKLSEISNSIPGLLKNRFNKMGIEYVSQVKALDKLEFLKLKGVGRGAAKQLLDFQNWLRANEEQLLKPEPRLIDLETYPSLGEIKFKNIENTIPEGLLPKFELHEIEQVSDLAKYTKKEFAALSYVGKATVERIEILTTILYEKQEELLREHKLKENGVAIPTDMSLDADVISLSRAFLTEYLQFLEEVEEERIAKFMRLFYALGINNQKRRSYKEIEILTGKITHERIRQIIANETLVDLHNILLKGECSSYLKLYARPLLRNKLKELHDFLLAKKAITKEHLLEILTDKFSVAEVLKHIDYINVLLDVFDAALMPSSIAERYTSCEEVYLFPSLKDPNQTSDYSFSNTGITVFNVLRELILPASKDDIILEVAAIDRGFKKENVELILRTFPEVEEIHLEGREDTHYQIRFDRLPSAAAMLERVLYEEGKKTHVTDLVAKINRRLTLLGLKAEVTRDAATANLSNRIDKIGKSGEYILADWDQNTKSIRKLIEEVMYTADKPLKIQEIVTQVQSLAPYRKRASIITIAHMHLYKTKKGRYILKAWKRRYNIKTVGPRYYPRHHYAIELIKESTSDKMLKSELLEELSKLPTFNRKLAYATLSRKYFIHSEDSLGQRWVEINQKVLNQRQKNAFKNKSKADILKEQMIEYLSHRGRIKLRDLVNYMEKQGAMRSTVYKVISDDPIVFDKKKYPDNRPDMISLVKGENINMWSFIRKNMLNDLEEIMSDPRKGLQSQAETDDLDAIFKMFKRLITYETTEENLNDLEEQLAYSIRSYYKSRHKSIKKGIFKKILTSLDPFLKKILFITNPQAYRFITQHNKRLGSIIKGLSKIDPDRNRYKGFKEANMLRFGKEIQKSYSTRNSIIYNAGDYSSTEIADIMRSALAVYLYAVALYYTELELNL